MSDRVDIIFDKNAKKRLQAMLGGLGSDVILRSMSATQRRQMKKVVEKAKDKAPKDRGVLKEAIGMKVTAKKKTGELFAAAGVKSMTVYDPKTKKKINPIRYSHLPEFGHVLRTRGTKGKKGTGAIIGQVAAQPYMRPAVAEVVGTDLGNQIMIDDIQKAIAKAVKRQKKGGSK